MEDQLTSMSIPDILYYNCQDPLPILESKIIQVSPRSRPGVGGVSMSTWKDLGSHGPFKFAFLRANWFSQFRSCVYGLERDHQTIISSPVDHNYIRNAMFTDEREWWSPTEVRFEYTQLLYIMFMVNAPCVLSKIKLNKIRRALSSKDGRWWSKYTEEHINDPYLQRGEHV